MNQIDLKGRVAVVTGGAQGIGYAAAERLLQSGAPSRCGTSMRHAGRGRAELSPLGAVSVQPVELTDEASVPPATAAR